MKKNYLEPETEYVKLVVGPIMQIVEASTWTGTGTGGTTCLCGPSAAGGP